MADAKHIFIAPLNWGWGHAVRCIPVIRKLQEKGFQITLGGNGSSGAFLRKEFPQLEFIELPNLALTYSKGNSQIGAVAQNIWPIIKYSILEHNAIKKIVQDKNIDVIISDNRFGLYASNCVNIYITHQINIALPKALKWAEWIPKKIHQLIISKFDFCWIPDDPDIQLSGRLGNIGLPKNARYIGIQSRYKLLEAKEKRYDYLFLLSGIEPQRSILEEKITHLCSYLKEEIMIVRGCLDKPDITSCSKNVHMLNSCSGNDLAAIIAGTKNIICRSGYTSIMELFSLSTPLVLIPTPGQPEQEYLAEHLSNKFTHIKMIKQNEIRTDLPVREITREENQTYIPNNELLCNVVKELEAILKYRNKTTD